MTDTPLLAGATGGLGDRVAPHLLHGEARVPLLSRGAADPCRRVGLAPHLASGAEVIEGDLADAVLIDRAIEGVDVVASTVQGGREVIVDGQVALARAGRRNGA